MTLLGVSSNDPNQQRQKAGPEKQRLAAKEKSEELLALCQSGSRQVCVARLGSCQTYASFAVAAFSQMLAHIPEEDTTQSLTAMAYGPNGQTYRGSVETARMLSRLVGAAYYGNGLYGKTSQEFSGYALRTCMKGDLF